jgi:NAD(P) transhydrogenase subunit beta
LTVWGRLLGKFKPTAFTGQDYLTRAVALSVLLFGGLFAMDTVAPEAYRYFALFVISALALGFLWVASLDDADLKVAPAVMNACAGLSACTLGFIVQNALLVAAGALAAGGGFALALALCKAVNRSFKEVLAGGIGASEISQKG